MARSNYYFGVNVPVFKEEKLGSGSFTIRFVVKGRVISKKNHQMAVCRRKEAKEFLHSIRGPISISDAMKAVDMVQGKMIGNIQYRDFLKVFKPVIQAQMKVWEQRLGSKGVKFPIPKAALSLKFYFADRYVTDTVNKQQTIQDLLVDCGVVPDDDYATLNPIVAKSASYYGKLKENICFISLSFKVENIKNDS